MKKKKLAVCAYESLDTKGGISVFVKNLMASEPVRSNYETLFIGADAFTRWGSLLTKPIVPYQVFRHLYRFCPDIVHVHDHEQILIAALMYKSIFPHSNIIYTHHTMPVGKKFILDKQYDSPHQGFIKRNVFSYLLSKCDAITCVSKSALERAVNQGIHLDPGKTSIVHGATKKIEIKPQMVEEARNKWGLQISDPILCMVSVLAWDSKVAGIVQLLEAMTYIKTDYPNIKLIIVGDGEFRDYVEEKIAAFDLDEHVILTGYVDDPAPMVHASDIYCHISLNEGLGLAILEAMVVGKPVVASNLGGIPEMIDHEHDGLLVGTEPAHIADAIRRLLQERNLAQQLGTNAKEKIRKKFTWDICGEQFVKLYEAHQG